MCFAFHPTIKLSKQDTQIYCKRNGDYNMIYAAAN